MSRVYQAIDWQRKSLGRLHGMRFIAITRTGATLDSRLCRPCPSAAYLVDTDGFAQIINRQHDGTLSLDTEFTSIQILKEQA